MLPSAVTRSSPEAHSFHKIQTHCVARQHVLIRLVKANSIQSGSLRIFDEERIGVQSTSLLIIKFRSPFWHVTFINCTLICCVLCHPHPECVVAITWA